MCNAISDDQMLIDLDFGRRDPNGNIEAEVKRFLEMFDVPKVSYKIAIEIAVEMFRPLPEEMSRVSNVVMRWCKKV